MRHKFVILALLGVLCLIAAAPVAAYDLPGDDVRVIQSICPRGLQGSASLNRLAEAAARVYAAQIALLERLEDRFGPVDNEWFAIEVCGVRFLIDPVELCPYGCGRGGGGGK
ncbi:MAG TPA: hypothetical protein VF234_03625 [Limnochordia bacterium]